MGERPEPPVASRIAAARDRFVRRRWRGRLSRWRGLLVVVVLLGVTAGGAWLLLGSNLMDVDDVAVSGTSQLGPAEVEQAADVPAGAPLARVDLDEIRARVEQLRAVASAEVVRDWPDTVHVVVTERQAVAVLEEAGTFQGLDATGVLFRAYASPPDGLPLVRSVDLTSSLTADGAAGRDDALREVALVIESLPPRIARTVDHVELESLDSIALLLADGSRVRWGSAEQSDLKAQVLRTLMSVPAATYDVSVPGFPTTSG